MLVEVKTGSNNLEREQLESYLEICRREGFDGVLSISNEIAPIAGHHPVRVDRRRFGRLDLHHLSWLRLLSVATTVKEHRGVSDPDQAWILGELIRYLKYEGSGAGEFNDMGQPWVPVRAVVRSGTLRSTDDGLPDLAQRWDQLIQSICLNLGAKLGQDVTPVLSRRDVNDPSLRAAGVMRDLVETSRLEGGIRIPNAVGPVGIEVDLKSMIGTVSVELRAPKLKRSTAIRSA